MRRRVIRSALLVLPAGLAACEASTAPRAEAAAASVSKRELGEGIFITIAASEDSQGAGILTLSCDGKRPEMTLDLVTPPASPPPLRGITGTFKVQGADPVSIELGWMGSAATWTPRENAEAAAAALIRQLIAGRDLTMTPPRNYTHNRPVRWSADALQPQAAEIIRWCG